MLLGHERRYDLGMDALLIARIQQLNVLGIGHGCSGDRRHSKNDRRPSYDLAMDALVNVSSKQLLRLYRICLRTQIPRHC